MPGKKRGTPVPTKEQIVGQDGVGSEPFVRYLDEMQKNYESLAAHVDALIPIGAIQMYAGLFSDIPKGWYLCDGNNGTPDLADRFLLATGEEGEIADIGGYEDPQLLDHIHDITHTHGESETGDESQDHYHDGLGATTWYQSNAGSGSGWEVIDSATPNYTGDNSRGHTHQVYIDELIEDSQATQSGDQTKGNLPPYFKVAYIMRME